MVLRQNLSALVAIFHWQDFGNPNLKVCGNEFIEARFGDNCKRRPSHSGHHQ